MSTVNHFWDEVWRVRWMVVLILAIVYGRSWGLLHPDSPVAVLATKPFGAMLGGVLGHIFRSQVFPYLDLGGMLGTGGEPPHPHAGLVFLACGLIYAAFILAVSAAFGV